MITEKDLIDTLAECREKDPTITHISFDVSKYSEVGPWAYGYIHRADGCDMYPSVDDLYGSIKQRKKYKQYWGTI